jgi:hypothetical protein
MTVSASFRVSELNSPVEFGALPYDRHFPFTAQGLILAVAGDVGICAGRKRFDDDAMQHGADSRASAIGIPRFPRIADPF